MTRRFTAWVITAGWITIALSACAPARYPPVVYAPSPFIVPPAPDAPYGEPPLYGTPPMAQPGAAPGAHAGMCDMQGHCYNSGPPQQVYHGDPAHPDRVTGPPAPIVNHPPVIVPPPSNDDGGTQ